jgi:hypothetical protein
MVRQRPRRLLLLRQRPGRLRAAECLAISAHGPGGVTSGVTETRRAAVRPLDGGRRTISEGLPTHTRK